MKRFISVLLCAAMLVSLTACSKKGGGEVDATAQQNQGTTSAFNSRYADMKEINSTSVLWSSNFQISVSMFTYFFNSVYHNYVDTGAYILDESVSLKEQVYSGSTTWFDYIAHETSNNVQLKLFMAEEAIANGITLTDEEYAEIDKEIELINNNAVAQNTSTAANIKRYYGDAVNEATIRKCLELNTLSQKYNEQFLDPKYQFKAEDYDKCFAENPKDYLAFNYFTYIIPAETSSEEATAQFAACKSAEEMHALIKARIGTDYPDFKPEEYDDRINELYVYGQYKSANSAFSEWAYNDARKAYDVYTRTETSGITYIAMLLPANTDGAYSEVLYKDVTPTHNVYAIAFLEMDYANDASKAHSIAQSVYEQAAGGSDILTLCDMYSGGSMSNVIPGDAPEAVEDWIFDEARKTDEVGLIKVEGVGSYVIKMRPDGGAVWQYRCALDLTDKIYQADVTAFSEKYPIGKNNEAVESVTEIAGDREFN